MQSIYSLVVNHYFGNQNATKHMLLKLWLYILYGCRNGFFTYS